MKRMFALFAALFLGRCLGMAQTSNPNVCDAFAQTGSDAGAKILACLSQFPPSGGVIDATRFPGAQTISENIFQSIKIPVTIHFGNAMFNFTVAQSVSSSNLTVDGTGATVWTVGFGRGDFFTIPDAVNYDTIKDLTVQPASGVTRSSGFLFNLGGAHHLFQHLEVIDPWNAFFVHNLLGSTLRDIKIQTTRAGTLNYGLFLYGTDIDNTIDNLYEASVYKVSDSFVHIRNRVSGLKVSTALLVSSEGGISTGAIVLDCDRGTSTSSSVAAPVACTSTYNATPTNRPELIRMSQIYIETFNTTPGVLMNGGQDIRFEDSYISGVQNAFKISGESTAIEIENNLLYTCTQQCIYDAATTSAGVGRAGLLISHNTIGAAGQTDYGTYADVEIASGTSNVRILGNRIGQSMFTNLAAYGKYGVLLDGSNNNIIIAENDFTDGNKSTANIYQAGTAGAGNVFIGNTGNGRVTDKIPFSCLNGPVLSAGQQICDDGSSSGGYNISIGAASSYGFRFWKGIAGTTLLGQIDPSGNFFVGNGSNTLYRCTAAGTLPVGALTTSTANCGASADTGLRIK
jgi:hypothetical protein